VTGRWRKLHNEELRDLYSALHINRSIKWSVEQNLKANRPDLNASLFRHLWRDWGNSRTVRISCPPAENLWNTNQRNLPLTKPARFYSWKTCIDNFVMMTRRKVRPCKT
jgi:hypothetical protein